MTVAGTSLEGVLWDTMFASKLHPSHGVIFEAAIRQRGTGLAPLLAAPVVSEVVFGLRRRPELARDAAWWEQNVVAGARRFTFVGASLQALVLAARVRALRPASAAPPRRDDGRKDPERRVAWSRDIELACIGATSGLPVATANLRDFDVIAGLIREVAPRLTFDLRESVFA